MDKQLLQKKKKLQEARNIINYLTGFELIHMNEPGDEPISLINYDKMGYYSNIKKPDEVFELDVSENLLCTFLKEKTHIGNGDIINLLLHNGIWIKVKITDMDSLITSCFKVAQSRWITFIDEQLINMYELCCDSRDEYHICYDEYKVELEC